MLVKYATLWLFTLPLFPCNLYVLFTSHFRIIYSGLNSRLCELRIDFFIEDG